MQADNDEEPEMLEKGIQHSDDEAANETSMLHNQYIYFIMSKIFINKIIPYYKYIFIKIIHFVVCKRL